MPYQRTDPLANAYFQNLATEVTGADQGQGVDLVFYGDSITESWRGTALGSLTARCAGSPAVFEKYFQSRTLDVLRFLRDSNPSSQVIAMGILPRGWEDEARRYTWPSRYSPSIAFVNAALAQYASQDDMILPERMPDGLHPSAVGMELMAQCLQPLIDQLMAL
ncbi:hypothetical protein COCSUDRAFT_58535 [Coccomyxa subellipsoidea C-169]|uniref:SGNH hydrolase-type esterase domain-containing protein n=1 Tax=Coccomyxa subellipsoidea (strain C-169) TaxID=574566 RepID=I0YN37_COCSC|nr:hypothetical protein COCSUDRAFT_58535 [Coccomyxa subellipsoidea C-169]EIE19806.1 hypothetical protein COCSUDRAFT_58535 [Coccomyxa subellipsoidea C-169]|eukprot:XP_005644350.1 hypothetical protein COCSUDRAFT_58535 [Coccomyxa subellipsoidea C-169]